MGTRNVIAIVVVGRSRYRLDWRARTRVLQRDDDCSSSTVDMALWCRIYYFLSRLPLSSVEANLIADIVLYI